MNAKESPPQDNKQEEYKRMAAKFTDEPIKTIKINAENREIQDQDSLTTIFFSLILAFLPDKSLK